MLTWAETKNLLAGKIRFHGESQISAGTTADDIKFNTEFDIRARLYYEMWSQDVYAFPVDKAAFLSMDLTKRFQNLGVLCGEKIFQADTVWISGYPICKVSSYRVLKHRFDPVLTTAGQPYHWAQVREFIISFERVPSQLYSSSYVSGYGLQPITGDGVIVEIPGKTVDVFCEYAAALFMSGVTQSKPGLQTLQMFNAHAFAGAQAIRAANLGYDFIGIRRGG